MPGSDAAGMVASGRKRKSRRERFNMNAMPSPTASSDSSQAVVPSNRRRTERSVVCEPLLSLPPPEGSTVRGGGPKKRGRPRKYRPDAPMALSIVQPIQATAASGRGRHPPPPPPPPTGAGGPSLEPPKKARGRPRGSVNKKRKNAPAPGSSGSGFNPHVILVGAGEDVASHIMALSQQSQMAVCILSAAGIISTVTFREPVAYGGTVTYEGYFQVLSLHGLFLPSENCGQRSGTGGLSISLCGAGGSVFGGCVAGFVRAATPVQVLVASFSMDGVGRIKLGKPIGTPSALRIPRTSRPRGGRSRSSRGTLRESSGGPGSPLDHNTPQGTAGMAWN